MNKIEAKEIADSLVVEKLEGFLLIDESTQEFDTCFAFYCQNDNCIQARDVGDINLGTGPIIVCKQLWSNQC